MQLSPHPAVTNPRYADAIRLIMRLRGVGVTETRVLSAIESVPRERFVPDAFADKAYDDVPLPIEMGQTISSPSVVAWMTWALDAGERMRVLEVGTGSGYQAAILAKLCRRVYTIERHKPLLDGAERRFREMAITNITARLGDGTRGWPETAPFDRIIVTAAAPEVPATLIDQLAEGGILVAPVGGESGEQMLIRLRKTPEGIQTQHLMQVRFVPLVEKTGR